jgi:hypothetical protein
MHFAGRDNLRGAPEAGNVVIRIRETGLLKPFKREVKPGTLSNILKKAEIAREELEDLL